MPKNRLPMVINVVARSWIFLCLSQISQYTDIVEPAIYTENSKPSYSMREGGELSFSSEYKGYNIHRIVASYRVKQGWSATERLQKSMVAHITSYSLEYDVILCRLNVCTMSLWWQKMLPHAMFIWNIPSEMVPLCRIVQVPSSEPDFRWLVPVLPKLAYLSILFIPELACRYRWHAQRSQFRLVPCYQITTRVQ